MASTSSAQDLESQLPTILGSEIVNTADEDGFQQTLELLQIDAEELFNEISHSAEELEGLKQYPCEYCSKVCKSKGGRTKHIRSKHDVEASKVEGINVGAKTKPIPSYVTEEKVLSLIREIAESLKDEKIYPTKQVDAVLTLRPNKAFVQDINALLHKFHCKKDRDRFMQEYYGKMYALWKEYFQPCKDHKVAFLMLINLPERLIILNKDGSEASSEVSQVTSEDGSELSVLPQELGPLAYVAGYVIQALYRKSINSKNANSQRNQEIQLLLLSMKVPTEENEYISSLSRGGLWAPNSWLVSIAEIAELSFKKHTKTGKLSSLPVDKVVDDVQTSPRAKSLWSNIVEQCDVQVTKECQLLCFENIIKLYATVRGFSFARDIVNKYKLSEKTLKQKSLRKQLKDDSKQL